MSEQPRNWDKELADIDKMIARMPATPASGGQPAAAPGGGGTPAAPATERGRGLAVMATWLRVILGLVLAVAITQWPYPNACGFNLVVYLGAILTVVVAGLWSSISSWRRRLGLAHLVSLGVLLWGLMLAAREILPRVGYARQVRSWTCGSAPAPGPVQPR